MIKRSISWRLALMFAVVAIAVVSTCAIMMRHALYQSLEKQIHNELQFRHTLVEPHILWRTTLDEWRTLPAKFENIATAEGGLVQHWIISEDPRFQIGEPPPSSLNWATLNSGFSTVMGETEGACLLFLLISEIPAQGERPALRYIVALDSTLYTDTQNEFTQTLIIITLIGSVLVALLGFIITRIGMCPVNNLSRQAQNLAPGNHNQRLDAASLPVELQKLAGSFNGVLERQEVAWRQLESFNADVAHELRTPLTNLIGQTQLGLSRSRSVDELEELLESNLEELERMTSIINDMLFLSHAQTGKYATQLTEVSLREEAFKTVDYIEPCLLDKALNVVIEGDVKAHIDRRLFHRALANLLENGARHAFPESTLTIGFRQEGNFAQIAVTNAGEPIDEAHLPLLFERFYRVDSSRTDSDSHHGLGLSIVRAIALVHRGDVFASSKEGLNTFGFTLDVGAAELALKREETVKRSQPITAEDSVVENA